MRHHPTRFLAACAVPFLLIACASEAPDAASASSAAVTSGPPPGCTPIRAGQIYIGGAPPITHGQQPTFSADLVTSIGDPSRRDQVRIRIDAAATTGAHSLADAGSCFEKGAECVVIAEDMNPATLIPAKSYAAVRGMVDIDAQVTPEERTGRVRGVELREITIASTNVPWRAASLVPGGACLWLEEAAFDTRRPDGCDPNAVDPCGAGRTCIARNAAGTDGTCVAATSTIAAGDACTPDADGGSGCEPGHRCIDVGAGARCTRTCDLLAATSGCADGTWCGPFGLCRAPAATDPARIGEACASENATCGRDGARGVCFVLYDPAGNPWSEGSKCWGYQRARSACAPGEDLGYASYAQGKDRSLGICTTRL